MWIICNNPDHLVFDSKSYSLIQLRSKYDAKGEIVAKIFLYFCYQTVQLFPELNALFVLCTTFVLLNVLRNHHKIAMDLIFFR